MHTTTPPGTTPLVATKLHAPRAAQPVLRRDALVTRLESLRQRRLALVSAPAGFGKSTLVADWVERSGLPSAWLSLEERDSEPTRFVLYLLAALRTVIPGVGEALEQGVQMSPRPPLEPLVADLVNQITADGRDIAFVIDDFHTVAGSDVAEVVQYIVEHAPATLHLVLITRVDPPFPLSRLRVSGDLVELRAEDLRFSADEAATYFNELLTLGVSAEHVARLQEKTEGWIAGLKMAGISITGRSDVAEFVDAFTGADRYVLDYLLEEVLSRQEPEVVEAMLDLSILSRFRAPLVETMTGVVNGAELLERLERANLFIVPLDGRREWYRFHHLFGNLLEHRLRRIDAARIPTLHQRAATWLERGGEISEAIRHAIASHDRSLLADLLERNWIGVMNAISEREETGLQLLDRDEIFSRPRLALIECHYHYHSVESTEMTRYLDAIDQLLPSIEGKPEYNDIAGGAAMFRAAALKDLGAFDEAVAAGERAVALLPDRAADSPEHFWDMSKGMAWSLLGSIYRAVGRLGDAADAFASAARHGRSRGDTQPMIFAVANLGFAFLSLGRLDEVLRRASELEAMEESLRLLTPYMLPLIPQLRAYVHYDRGEFPQAIEAAENAFTHLPIRGSVTQIDLYRMLMEIGHITGDEELARRSIAAIEEVPAERIDPRAPVMIDLARAARALHDGRYDLVERWGRRHGPDADDPILASRSFSQKAIERALWMRYLTTMGRHDEALRINDEELALVRGSEHRSLLIDVLAIRTLTAWRAGNEVMARDALDEALRMALPEGMIRPLLAVRDEIVDLLRSYVREHQSSPAGRLAARIVEWRPGAALEPQQAPVERPTAAGHLADLTPRELEILKLIAMGYSNQKIADKLYVSINTIKTHTLNLYDKLGVGSRTEAAARAREAGVG